MRDYGGDIHDFTLKLWLRIKPVSNSSSSRRSQFNNKAINVDVCL